MTASQQDPAIMDNRTHRLLLIGCGRAGARFLSAFRYLFAADHLRLRLAGVCDQDASRATALGRGAPAFVDVAAALAAVDPDVVCVCVSERAHHAVLTRLFSHRSRPLRVICEKPFTETLDQAEDLLAASLRHDVTVNYCERYSRAVEDFLSWKSGRALDFRRAEFFWGKNRVFDSRPTMGVLSEITHPLDLLRVLVGLPVTSTFDVDHLSAMKSDYSVEYDHQIDALDFRGRLDGRLPVVGHSSFVWSRRDRRVELFFRDRLDGAALLATFQFDNPVWDCDELSIMRHSPRERRWESLLQRQYDRSTIDPAARGVAKLVELVQASMAPSIRDERHVTVQDAMWVQRALTELSRRAEEVCSAGQRADGRVFRAAPAGVGDPPIPKYLAATNESWGL